MLYSKKTWDALTTDSTKVIKRGEIVEEPLLRHTDTEKPCELMPPFGICVGTLSYKQTPMKVSGLVVPDSKREVKKKQCHLIKNRNCACVWNPNSTRRN